MSDTSPRAREFYYARLAELTPAERLAIAMSLWETAGSLQLAALRLRYPGADESEINFHIAVSRFGPELARKAWRRT